MNKPVKWLDQFAHGGVAFLIVMLSGIPVISGIVGALRFAVTREYYQGKRKIKEALMLQGSEEEPKFMAVMSRMNWFKRDLVAAYVGAGVGIPAAIVVYWQLFLWLKTWL